MIKDMLTIGRIAKLRNGKMYIMTGRQLLSNDSWVDSLIYDNELLSDGEDTFDVMAIYDLASNGQFGFNLTTCNLKYLRLVWERYTLPKLNYDELVILKAFVFDGRYTHIARDEDGKVCLYKSNPFRYIHAWWNNGGSEGTIILPTSQFKTITWENGSHVIKDLVEGE